ncbi:response regulator transcription factor [Phycicoccus sp. BSK3Z-2]|uniref:Response regulator transcription factor n=1 Tax=Phycicoccus avicenniae TaxID=2828860 RepID=A0A941D7P6_9MICO|nr:response regulator transcription factor [Phycicoccus avicenniae]MBR7742638.1 response regulator transcription factor [Phycicoccus avicenniae]
MPYTVCIVDDSDVMRRGIRSLVETDDGLEIVAEARDGDEAVAEVARTRPDVVLLDVRMPARDGVSVVREISQTSHVLMLTFSDESEVILAALDEGAVGYLVHGTFDAEGLGAMVRAAAQGIGSLSGPALAAVRGGSGTTRSVAHRGAFELSERQAEVMDLVAAGKGNGAIARELFLSEKTVKNHINQIFPKLGVTTRAEAIVVWLGSGPGS